MCSKMMYVKDYLYVEEFDVYYSWIMICMKERDACYSWFMMYMEECMLLMSYDVHVTYVLWCVWKSVTYVLMP